MNLNQEEVKKEIEFYANLLGIDPTWASAVAMVESSLGEHRISRTNCRGIFQMSSIAMEDLRLEMGSEDDDTIEIVCGLLFLRLLRNRWGSIEEATNHFCDPNDRDFYLDRVLGYMEEFKPKPLAPVIAETVQPPKNWWERMFG